MKPGYTVEEKKRMIPKVGYLCRVVAGHAHWPGWPHLCWVNALITKVHDSYIESVMKA